MPLDSSPEINFSNIYTGELSKATSLISYINLWLEDSQDELHKLKELPENWDSYGSPRIKDVSVKTTADLLINLAKLGMPKPYLFPVSGGGLQLEWQQSNRELEIEVLPDGRIEYLKVYEDGKMTESTIDKMYVWQLVKWFRENEQPTFLREEPITMSL
jgi:hypothetical protein